MFRSAAAMRSRIGGKLATSVTIDDSINRPARRLASACISRSRRRKSINWFGRACLTMAAFHHDLEICIVDGGRDRFQEIFMVFSDGERQSAPLRGNFDAFRDGLIERSEPLVHSGARHLDLVVLAGVEIRSRSILAFSIWIAPRYRGRFQFFAFLPRPPSIAERRRPGCSPPRRAAATRRSPACCGIRFPPSSR